MQNYFSLFSLIPFLNTIFCTNHFRWLQALNYLWGFQLWFCCNLSLKLFDLVFEMSWYGGCFYWHTEQRKFLDVNLSSKWEKFSAIPILIVPVFFNGWKKSSEKIYSKHIQKIRKCWSFLLLWSGFNYESCKEQRVKIQNPTVVLLTDTRAITFKFSDNLLLLINVCDVYTNT